MPIVTANVINLFREKLVAQLKISLALYPLESILKTCYVFLDRAYLYLEMNRAGKKVIVSIKRKPSAVPRRTHELLDAFQKELLRNAFRSVMAGRTRKLREYIVGKALYGDAFRVSSHCRQAKEDDPLGICTPATRSNAPKKQKKVSRKV